MNSDFGLPVEMAEQIEQTLSNLRRMTEGECVMLADVSGQLISLHGELEKSDPVLIAALAAGDVAAMSELSRQIGERNPSGSFLHEGEHKSIYLLNVGSSFILLVIFRAETLVGMVRLFTGRAAEQLETISRDYETLMGQPKAIPNTDFGTALAGELEKAFNDF
jgi:predicted regulator of Ras-like GTPase activity (Roadblock/LC7/MglB family)